jgi:hypothetical protein
MQLDCIPFTKEIGDTMDATLNDRCVALADLLADCWQSRADVVRRDPEERLQVMRLDNEAARLRRKVDEWRDNPARK